MESRLDDILDASPVIPVITLEDDLDPVAMAGAFLDGGLRVIEITLRTPGALEAIRQILRDVPDMIVGGGTVRSADDLWRLGQAGAHFAVSPGLTPALADAARARSVPLLPGVATASEVMAAAGHGFTRLKFFPAEAAGGVAALKSLAGPFPDIRFCPTGGIRPDTAPRYLALANVACVGGSWLLPTAQPGVQRLKEITRLAREAQALRRKSTPRTPEASLVGTRRG